MELVYALTFALAGFLVVLIARVYVAKSGGHPVKFAEKARHSAQITSGGWKVLGWVLAILLVARVGYWVFSGTLSSPVGNTASHQYAQPARPASAPAPAVPNSKPMSGTLTMPPNGDSRPIVVPRGQVASFGEGEGDYSIHCVYREQGKKREGVVGDSSNPCRDGFASVYVHDKSGEPNSVTYVFSLPH